MSDYSSNFPQQRPTLNLDFANGGDQLDSRLSYSRSSTGTAFSSERHLSSENLVPYSNLSSGFTFGRTTLASTNNSAPDGGSDAASILETAVSGSHEAYDSFGCVSGQQYSFVFYIKANGRTKVIFKPQATSTIANVTFDLTAVTSTVTSGSADSHSITAIGSTGWYKCAATVTATASGTGYTQINLVDGTGASTYTGDVTKGVFAWGASVSSTGETVLNETSGSIHREYSSTLKTAAADAPRFEYAADGQSVGTALGLLVESQVTNLAIDSEEVNNWTTVAASVQQNVAISPAGTLTADRLTDDAAGPTSHYVYETTPLGVSVGSTVYTVSFFAKASGRSELQSYDNNQTTSANVTVNLASGTITSGTGVIKSCGDGWYRISYQATADLSTSSVVRILMKDGGSSSYTGDSYSGILIWGLQIEIGSAPSSLISTSGATATRAADSCSVATADFGYTGGPVSVISEFAGGSGYYPEVWELRDTVSKAAGVNDYILPIKYSAAASSSTNWQTWINDSGNLTQTTISASSTATKLGVSVDSNSVASCANGGTIYDTTSTVIPDSLDTLYIGRAYASSITLNGHIKRLSLYSVALSDVELQSLTS